MLAYRLLDPSLDLLTYTDITEDIANRIDSIRNQFETIDQFIQLATARNLTATRISRCLFHILLGHRKEIMNAWTASGFNGYMRVLGFKKTASFFFRHLSESSKNQLLMKPSMGKNTLSGTALQLFEADMYAAGLYRQILQSRYHSPERDIYSEPLIIID
jgi:predicted nucleotidyltransferase